VPLGLPAVEAQHLLEVLHSVGFSQPAGMGMAAVSFSEVMAWCQAMQHPLEPWEFEAVRAASRAFCSQLSSDDPREPNFNTEEAKATSPIRAMAAALNKTSADTKPKRPIK
jgi:hypothetical protein